jgi:hypothetical protein
MYKIYQHRKPFALKYVIRKRVGLFKWKWVLDYDGCITMYDTAKGAQAYINQMNKLHNESRRPCSLCRCFNKTR